MRSNFLAARKHLGFWALALVLASTASCGSDSDHHDDEGTGSGAVCPSGSTLTYENFGKPFMDAYCTRCHSTSVTGANRNGAPDDHNLDTLSAIKAIADHTDEEAAAGPTSTNESMPPDGAKPTDAERMKLGEWLACLQGGPVGDGGTEDTGSASDARGDTAGDSARDR